MDQNLLKSPEVKNQERFVFVLTLAPLLILGLTKLVLGLYYHKPVLFLVAALLIGTGIIAFIIRIDRKYTPHGLAFLRGQEIQFRWLKSLPRSGLSEEEISKLAYIPSVLGVGALVGMLEFHEFYSAMKEVDLPTILTRMNNHGGSSSSGGCGSGGCSGSSGCCGSSGCSGGGCGGCGGGGD